MNAQNFLKIADSPPRLQELFHLASETRKRAYCRYSGYQVGAAIRLSNGIVFTGCNVENASYGATVCAERVAIQKAVSELGGTFEITEVMVVTDASPPWPPCGMCRQVIAEFAKKATIHTADLTGSYQTMEFEELFPKAFTSVNLG